MKYAYSLKTERVKEPDFPYSHIKIRSAQDVAEFAKKIKDSDVEKFVTIFLNSNNKIICVQVVIGTVNCAMPFCREIFKHALLSQAANIIMTHNHPSDNISPSAEDKKFTQEVATAGKLFGIKVLDHIIIGNESFFSFAEEGLI